MNTRARYLLLGSVIAGLFFGLLVISPLAMIVADLSHQGHAQSVDLSLIQSIAFSFREAFGPGLALWKWAHALVGALFGLIMGLAFLFILKRTHELHELQNEFRRQEMTFEIGKLVRGIVHNINNHLSILQGNADLLKMDHPDDPKVDSLLEACKALRDMGRNILAHAKLQKGVLQEIDLNSVIEKNIEFLKGNSFFKHDVEVHLNLDPALPKITGQESDFLQSLYNLLDNAVDAMIRTPRKELTIATRRDPEKIYIEITDSGEGIPKEVLPKLFTPGFTTKPFEAREGEPTGTGFGLANVKDLLKPYNVKIDVTSRSGETRFILSIPHQEKKPTVAPQTAGTLKQAA